MRADTSEPTDSPPAASAALETVKSPSKEEMHARMQELLQSIRASLQAGLSTEQPVQEADGGAPRRIPSGGHTPGRARTPPSDRVGEERQG